MTKDRNYLFTSFRTIDRGNMEHHPNVQYFVYQLEKAPTTGQAHYQGYIELKNSATIAAVKKIINDSTAHIEPRRGTQAQAIAYCSKDETRANADMAPRTYGIPRNDPASSKQGHRTDLDQIWEDVESGLTCKEILIKHKGNGLRHVNHIRRALQVYHDWDIIDGMIKDKRSGEVLGAFFDAISPSRAIAHNDAKLDDIT